MGVFGTGGDEGFFGDKFVLSKPLNAPFSSTPRCLLILLITDCLSLEVIFHAGYRS